MKWEVLSLLDYVSAAWSGGTTTQLAISPAGAKYADRDFLWRLSSARTEVGHSTFTSLPDYDRFISVLDGSLSMKIGDEKRFSLPKFLICEFDGGVPVEAWGRCTDFNLMLRKKRCLGCLVHGTLLPQKSVRYEYSVQLPDKPSSWDVSVYCVEGDVKLETGELISKGGLLLCRDADSSDVAFSSVGGAEFMMAVVYSQQEGVLDSSTSHVEVSRSDL